MKFKYRATTAIGALTLALSVGLALAANVTPANASQPQICGNYGSGYCLNDWNGGGSGNAVKMETGGNTNEDFVAEGVTACSGGDIVTPTCPFATRSIDAHLQGWQIIQVKYVPKGLCIATNSSGGAVLGTCANPNTGSGGSDGVIMVKFPVAPCQGGYPDGYYYYVDRYWSDAYGTEETLASGGNPGVQAYLTYGGYGTCWGD
jgi:hypothetical protein